MPSHKDVTTALPALVLGFACAGCAAAQLRLPGPAPAAVAQAPPPPAPVQRGSLPELPVPGTPPAGGVVPAAANVPPPDGKPPAPETKVVPPVPATEPQTSAPMLAMPSGPLARPWALYRLAAERYATMDSYIVRLRRRETVNGKDKPNETLLLKFRKQPWSVYFKWLDGDGQGREVTYVKGRYDGKLHTLLAAGDMPFMPAGKRIALPPDSPFVRASSRHSITEAGIGALIDLYAQALEAVEKGEPKAGTMKYMGLVKRNDLPEPLECVEQTIPPGAESLLPRGGRRLWLFDPVSHLPSVVITHDATGHEVEYYAYDRFQFPVHLDDADFDPDKLWSSGKMPGERGTAAPRGSADANGDPQPPR